MISEYVLLCAPYRFLQDYMQILNKETIEEEFFSAILPGVNFLTRKLILEGIKNNFCIVDKQSLIQQVNTLYEWEYHSLSDLENL